MSDTFLLSAPARIDPTLEYGDGTVSIDWVIGRNAIQGRASRATRELVCQFHIPRSWVTSGIKPQETEFFLEVAFVQ